MARVEFNKEEYFGGLDEYWRRVNESQGFDIEGIVGPKGMVASGQLLSYQCEGLGRRSYILLARRLNATGDLVFVVTISFCNSRINPT